MHKLMFTRLDSAFAVLGALANSIVLLSTREKSNPSPPAGTLVKGYTEDDMNDLVNAMGTFINLRLPEDPEAKTPPDLSLSLIDAVV